MKQREAKQLYRLYRVMTIPLPQSGYGIKSASMKGYVSFGVDAAYALPLIADCMRQVYQGEDYVGCLEEKLTELEAWYAQRVKQNWGDSSHDE